MSNRQQLSAGFQFGEWTVRPDDGSLVSSNRSQRLEPLLTNLLVFLCSHPGQVVSKEQIIAAVWNDRFISDATIKASFYQLPKALGDDSRNPRFIETLPKRGYRILLRPMPLAVVVGEGGTVDELYDKGRSILSGQASPAALREARLYFERAIEVQPRHAESLAALAHIYIQLVILAVARGSDLLPRAEALAMRAVEVDSRLAAAHVALGITQLLYKRTLAAAERTFRLAIELDPGDASAHLWYAKLLSSKARHEEAITAAQTAMNSDPLSMSLRRNLVEILFTARHYDRTIVEAQQLVRTTKHAPDVQLVLVWVFFMKGEHDRAFESLVRGLRSLGTGPEILGRAERAFQDGGMKSVLRLWAEIMEQQDVLGQKSIDLLVLYGLLGEKDRCFRLLELAAKQFHPVILWLPVSPIFDNLRSDRRYNPFLERYGLACS
jgi:serine/threonine-protein kinase